MARGVLGGIQDPGPPEAALNLCDCEKFIVFSEPQFPPAPLCALVSCRGQGEEHACGRWNSKV